MKHSWAEVDAVFTRALEVPAGDRERLLSAECGDDRELCERVRELLVAAEAADEVLTAGGVGTSRLWAELSASLAGSDGLAPDDRAGTYRLIREIGHGGMAVVYLAERADGLFEQQVALKVLQIGADDHEVVRRFEQERRILASLEHPGIARLVDGGVTEGGRPYLVMEHVAGDAIDRHCDELGLTVEQRMRLFLEVADAVQYAHSRLVVHRDLKPSNILVTAEGRVKLLDFGIAKLLDESVAVATRTGRQLMTLQYASPEQFRGEPVSTSSDVYQLGLLLYRLLTGQPPYRITAGAADEAARLICEQEPQSPSTTLQLARSADSEATTEVRGKPPDRPVTRLAGDLDAIVMMALRKEPERRYRTVEQMAADISRHLDGLPVAARPNSLGYRLGRFVRRHRAGVASAVLVALSLVAGIVGTALQARRAEREAERANREAAAAEQVSDFLIGLFEMSDLEQASGETITAREILDRGAARVRRELDHQPEAQIVLMKAIGAVYAGLGLYNRAGEMYDEAYEIGRRHLGPDHVEMVRILDARGELSMSAGRYDEAVALHREALARRQELYGERHPEVAESLNNLAVARYGQGSHEGTEEMLRLALELREEGLGNDDPATAETMQNLAFELQRQGRHGEAERLFRQALAIFRGQPDSDYRELAASLSYLATALSRQARPQESLRYHREALELQRKLLGDEHPLVARELNNLAATLTSIGNYAEAERMLRQALEIQRAILGEDHPDFALSIGNLGNALYQQGHFDEAASLHRQSLALHRRLLGEKHAYTARSMSNLCNVLNYLEQHEEAERHLVLALEIQRTELGRGHVASATTASILAVARHGRGDLDHAERLYREALDTFDGKLPADHALWARPLVGLGRLLTDSGQAEVAEPLLERALDIRRKVKRPGDVLLAEAESSLGTCLVELGRSAEAEPLLLASVPVLEGALGTDHGLSRRARQALEALPLR